MVSPLIPSTRDCGDRNNLLVFNNTKTYFMMSKLVKINLIIPFTILCSLIYYSCGSKGYDIEEIQQEVFIDSSSKTVAADQEPSTLEPSKEMTAYEKPKDITKEEPQEKIKENLFDK